MNKKFVSLVLACTMFSSCLCNAMAHESIVQDEDDGSAEITMQSTSIAGAAAKDIQDSVKAFVLQEDGTKIPVDCIITVEEVTSARSTSEITYRIGVRSAQKTISNSADFNKSEVIASAYVEMLWTDNLGTGNSITHISGYVSITKGAFESATAGYGENHPRESRISVDEIFDQDVSYTGGALRPDVHACYAVSFEETANTLFVEVHP